MAQQSPRQLSRFRLWSLGALAFVLIYKVFDALANVASIIEGWKFLEEKWPLLAKLPDWVGMLVAAVVALAITIVGARAYLSRRLRNLPFPPPWGPQLGTFSKDPKLVFDYVRDPTEIAELALTENYGAKGQTDVPLATTWWKRYPQGNTLVKYKGEIIGGIDLWPITKRAYLQILEGTLGDLDLRPHHFRLTKPKSASYWYAGSVSLAAVWRRNQHRRELLLRLLVNTMQSWLARDPTFPAQIVAQAWTDQGRNLLLRLGFDFHRRKEGSTQVDDPTYTIRFPTRQDALAFVAKLQAKLG